MWEFTPQSYALSPLSALVLGHLLWLQVEKTSFDICWSKPLQLKVSITKLALIPWFKIFNRQGVKK
jgi:hypothetical protein